MKVALVHDYLTQRGGAERVVLSMLKAFPDAPVYTSLFDPDGTFPEFRSVDVRTTPLDRIGLLRRRHRLALPLLARAFDRLEVECDVAICSSSGWAHGAQVSGRKIVYCHAPARWLYQDDRYMRGGAPARLPLALLRARLLAWDHRAAASADLYLANSTAVRRGIRRAYGIEAEVLHPPSTIDVDGRQRPVEGVAPGFFLCVSRLLPYKNVGAIVQGFAELGEERLVVVGTGPEESRLRAKAPQNVRLLGSVDDHELRWLYASSRGVVAASYEDFGMTPVEAAAFAKPAVVLRWGGFLDTVVEGTTGVFFDEPKPEHIRAAVRSLRLTEWEPALLLRHASEFSEDRFGERLAERAAEVCGARLAEPVEVRT